MNHCHGNNSSERKRFCTIAQQPADMLSSLDIIPYKCFLNIPLEVNRLHFNTDIINWLLCSKVESSRKNKHTPLLFWAHIQVFLSILRTPLLICTVLYTCLLHCKAQVFKYHFFITDVLSSRSCGEIKWYRNGITDHEMTEASVEAIDFFN